MHPLPEGLQQLLYIKNIWGNHIWSRIVWDMLFSHMYLPTQTPMNVWAEMNGTATTMKILRLEVWVLKMPSGYIEITKEVNICSLEPICIYLSVRLYSALCLAVGHRSIFFSLLPDFRQLCRAMWGMDPVWMIKTRQRDWATETGTDGTMFWY